MDNFKVKVTVVNGAPSATVEKRTVSQAIGDSLSCMLKDDEASVGYVKTGVSVGLAYASALYAKYRQTGRFDWNPL